MTSPLDNTNSHGIRVVANRGPVREEAKQAFARESRRAVAGISRLTQPRRRARTAASARLAK